MEMKSYNVCRPARARPRGRRWMACRQDISRNLQLTDVGGGLAVASPSPPSLSLSLFLPCRTNDEKLGPTFPAPLSLSLRHDTAILFPDNVKQRGGHEISSSARARAAPAPRFVHSAAAEAASEKIIAASEFRLFRRRRIRIISSATLTRRQRRRRSGPSSFYCSPLSRFCASEICIRG